MTQYRVYSNDFWMKFELELDGSWAEAFQRQFLNQIQMKGKGNCSELPKSRIALISIATRTCFKAASQILSELELDYNGKSKEYRVHSNGFLIISLNWKRMEAALKHFKPNLQSNLN